MSKRQKTENPQAGQTREELQTEIQLLNADVDLLIDELDKMRKHIGRQDIIIHSQVELIKRLVQHGRAERQTKIQETTNQLITDTVSLSLL